MTKDDIVRMAREAGGYEKHKIFYFTIDDLERFANFVAAAERKACAMVCEKAIASIWEYSPEDVKQTGTNVCNNLAAAIRARGKA